jgi:hypothetical protein
MLTVFEERRLMTLLTCFDHDFSIDILINILDEG